MHPAAEASQAAAYSFFSALLLRSEGYTREDPISKLPVNTLLLFILSSSLLVLEICPQGMAKNLLMNLNWHETSMGMVMVG